MHPALTGTYVNLSNAYRSKYYLTNDKSCLIESISLARYAIAIKPTNEKAICSLIEASILAHDYYSACLAVEQYPLVSDYDVFGKDFIRVIDELIMFLGNNIITYEYLFGLDEASLQGLEHFISVLVDKYNKEAAIRFIAAQFYDFTGNNLSNAEINYLWCIENSNNKELRKNAYFHLGYLYISMSPDHYEKGIEYIEESLKYVDNVNELQERQQPYAASLNRIGRPEIAEPILRKLAHDNPSDSNYFNLARCLSLQNKLAEAYVWAQKALFIVEDDQNLMLFADVCKRMKRYEEAIEYYEKAIAFARECHSIISYTDENGIEMKSFEKKRDTNATIEILYDGIIVAYAKSNQFKKAAIYLALAEKEYPYSSKWEVYHELLPDIEATEIQVKQLEIELNDLRQQCKAQQNAIRKWASALMALQDKSVDSNLEDPVEWEAFERSIDNIIRTMKSSTIDGNRVYETTKQQFKQEFATLDNDSLEFLVTAETLYQLHKNSTIDFAAIVVEFCKVIEKQLRVLLGRKLPYNAKMLGQVIYEIENQPIPPYDKIIQELNEVNKYRKESAHTGVLRRIDVEQLRRLFYSEGLLNKLS